MAAFASAVSIIMTIKITCPHCDQPIEAPGEVLGTIVACPTCAREFHVGQPPTTVQAPPAQPSKPRSATAKKVLLFSAFGCGAVIVSVVGFVILVAILSSSGQPGSSSPSLSVPPLIEGVLAGVAQNGFNANKQALFDSFHPVGTAKTVTVHDVSINGWKHGHPSDDANDIQQFTVRFTIYWEGPITTDGYTKISAVFDVETGRYVASQVLATNGITNKDAGDALLEIGGALLLNALQGN